MPKPKLSKEEVIEQVQLNGNSAVRKGVKIAIQTTDDEKAAGHVRAALDSVTLINNLVANDASSREDIGTLARNIEHLKITVNRDVVKNSQEDLAPLNDAITAGEAYMATLPTAPNE